ncbi:MAG: hypothetical protein V1738_04120 [Patescibacteria group bacterium]
MAIISDNYKGRSFTINPTKKEGEKEKMDVIVTIPPYAPWIEEVAKHPVVSGLRLNTVMRIREPFVSTLKAIAACTHGKPLWIDLKTRQIRTAYGRYYGLPTGMPETVTVHGETYKLDPSEPLIHGDVRCAPWATLRIMNKIKVDLSKGPIPCYFNDGLQKAQLVDVIDGNELVFLDGPKKRIGPGESINIMHPSLEIEGFINEMDHKFIAAAKDAGVHNYMLSYVEKDSDIEEMLAADPEANIRAKVESREGVRWVREGYRKNWKGHPRVNLVAATGDLYVEVGTPRPEKILRPLRQIISADKDAWMASRVMSSLRESERPAFTEFTSLGYFHLLGFPHIMIGEEIFMQKDTVLLALDMLQATFKECDEIAAEFGDGRRKR